MSPRKRRLAAAAVVAAVVAVVVAAYRPAEQPTTSFRVVLGLKDQQPTDWSGQVAVAGGEAVEIKGWRFEEKDAVQDAAKWTCKTRNYIKPGDRFPLDPASGKPPPPPEQPWPNGVVLTVRGADPAVTLTLPAGEMKFVAGDVPLGQPKSFLDGQVRVERLPAVSVCGRRPASKSLSRFRTTTPPSGSATRPANSIWHGSRTRRRRTACCSPSATGRTAPGRSRSRWTGRATTSASPWPARMTTFSGSSGLPSATTSGTCGAGPTRTASSATGCSLPTIRGRTSGTA